VYVLTYLGAPLGFPDAGRALALGAAGVALLLVTLAGLARCRALGSVCLIWIELALFALLTAGETAYVRLAQGSSEAISSRYQVWSSLWWVALSVLGVLAVRARWVADAWGAGARVWWARARARLIVVCQVGALVALCAAALVVNDTGITYTRLFVLPMQYHQACALHYQESPAGCTHYYTKGGLLNFQTWSALLQTQHNAIFVTGAVGSYSPQAAVLPLVRYYNRGDLDHWTTTNFFAPAGPENIAAPPGYRPDELIGYLYDTPRPGTAPLYSCLVGASDHMLSRQADCEGQRQLGIQGWLYAVLPRGLYVKPLYRCLVGADHFVSTQENCESFQTEGLLGWVLAAPGT
jgi:hypothetical protein